MPSNIVVPEVGESIVDARVAKWLRKEGDAVAIGDPLVELETDKVDLEVAATQAGVLKRIDRRGRRRREGRRSAWRDRRCGGCDDDCGQRRRKGDRDRAATRGSRQGSGGSESSGRENALDTDRAQGGRRQGCRSQHASRQRRCRAGSCCATCRRRPAAKAPQRLETGMRARHPPTPGARPRPAPRLRSPKLRAARLASASTSASACRSGAPRLPAGWSRRRAPPRCSRPSTRST